MEKPEGLNALRQIASQNPGIAASLEALEERARKELQVITPLFNRETFRWSYMRAPASSPAERDILCYRVLSSAHSLALGLIFLVAAVIIFSIYVGPNLYHFFLSYWKILLLIIGGFLAGSGLIMVLGHVDRDPIREIQALESQSDEPLQELERLAKRTVSRLRAAYRLQIVLVCMVFFVLLLLLGWSLYMITKNRLTYAAVFGSTGVGMLILSRWKWQPFDRVTQARKIADEADILATGLWLRIKSLSEISDPKERAQAQWQAVREYLKEVLPR